MTTTRDRRTVASMDARLAQARKLIEKMRDDARAKHGAQRAAGNYSDSFEHGAACGLDQALTTLEWAFAPEQDWMYRS